MTEHSYAVIGGGLAGCECALRLARAGLQVTLFEQKPAFRSPAHVSDGLAELVCSNSLRSDELTSGIGLLKAEMRELGSVADREHERLGRHLAQLRPVLVFWRGGHADAVRDGLEHGLYTGRFLPVESGEGFVQALREHLPADTGGQGGLMLFKGSRGNHLEELLEALERSDWLPGSRTESL